MVLGEILQSIVIFLYIIEMIELNKEKNRMKKIFKTILIRNIKFKEKLILDNIILEL